MYNYTTERPNLFTESGQEMFIAIRDCVHAGLKTCGAIRLQEATAAARSGSSGTMIACLDRLVELGEIREITPKGAVWGQHRVFVSARE